MMTWRTREQASKAVLLQSGGTIQDYLPVVDHQSRECPTDLPTGNLLGYPFNEGSLSPAGTSLNLFDKKLTNAEVNWPLSGRVQSAGLQVSSGQGSPALCVHGSQQTRREAARHTKITMWAHLELSPSGSSAAKFYHVEMSQSPTNVRPSRRLCRLLREPRCW